MKYITLFETDAAYNAATLDLPNVSLIEETMNVVYKPYDPYMGHEYVEIGGLKWATMNIGANSITDTGLRFQWGDTQGYTDDQVGNGEGQKYFDWTDYKYATNAQKWSADMTKYNITDDKTVLDVSDDAAIINWGGSWRIPTNDEYAALGEAVNTEWTADYQGSGVAGLICTDKTDSSKVLFFPAVGNCYQGSVDLIGRYGEYWSSSLDSNYIMNAYYLNFHDADNDTFEVDWQSKDFRCSGYAVRAVAD
jgi:uncharacterized protein (TIGR02145 family)